MRPVNSLEDGKVHEARGFYGVKKTLSRLWSIFRGLVLSLLLLIFYFTSFILLEKSREPLMTFVLPFLVWNWIPMVIFFHNIVLDIFRAKNRTYHKCHHISFQMNMKHSKRQQWILKCHLSVYVYKRGKRAPLIMKSVIDSPVTWGFESPKENMGNSYNPSTMSVILMFRVGNGLCISKRGVIFTICQIFFNKIYMVSCNFQL